MIDRWLDQAATLIGDYRFVAGEGFVFAAWSISYLAGAEWLSGLVVAFLAALCAVHSVALVLIQRRNEQYDALIHDIDERLAAAMREVQEHRPDA